MSYEQVFGLSSQFNEDVIFLKDVRINGQISFGTNISFNVPVTFDENVTFKKSIIVDENVRVTGISTFTGLVKTINLNVLNRLNVGADGEILNADVGTGKIGLFNQNPTTKLQFNSIESQSIFFDDEGRIGIGEDTIGSSVGSLDDINQGVLKLDVKGSIAIDRNIYDSSGAPGENNFFLSRDVNGIRWVSINPQDAVGIFLQDEGVFVPTVGAAQSFTTLNFVQKNSGGIGTDTLIPTAANPSSATGLSTIFTQDLWGFVGSGDNAKIYRMSLVGINNDDPSYQLDIAGTLRATGQVLFSDATDSTENTNGALIVDGGLGLGKNLNMGGNLDVDGTGDIKSTDDSSSNGTGALVVAGGVGIGNNLNMGGNLDVDGTGKIGSSDSSTSNTTGALTVGGGLGLGENLNMGGNIDVDGTGKIGSADQSSSNTTGALTVGGGLGLGKNLNMGGNLDVDGSGRIGSTLELDGALQDVNDSTGTGKTDYRLSTVGTGVSWRPPGVQTKKTIWVSKNGSDLNSGLLEGDAKASLGGAAAVAQEGDTIKIRPGKYLENNPVGLRTDVSVTGEDLRLVTIVPENKNDDVIHVRRGCLVENLSFAGGVSGSGVEIGCDGAGAVAFPPTSGDGQGARSGYTEPGPATEGSSGRWRSPYIRNCTNFMTGSIGMKINGDHATSSDPDSGSDLKSMVCDSFTQYNEAGIGVSLTNDSYAQLVSIFTINCDIAIYADTGGQCDLTNSNSSFGNFGLVAVGLGATQYTGFASNTNSAGEIITENASEIDTIVAYGVTDTDGDDQRPFDGQALYFKINNVGQQNYPTVPAFDRIEAPMKELSAINIIPGSDLTGYSALNPPSVTILDGDTVNNPGGGPLGPQGIVAEGSATVDETGTITEFNVIASGRNYLPTQNLIVDVDGDTGIATAVTEPIFYTVFQATPNTGYYNKLTESDPGIVGITTITFNEFIPYPVFPDDPFTLQRISRILTSSHSFEYVGTGTDINRSTPLVGGVPIKENEVVASQGAQIPFTSTDQKGNFDIGEGLQIDQTTSTIRGRDFSRAIQVEVTPLILALR
tara:strand:- start:5650 stop:8829 length:3180 start_codon:yes stop_codon:yes gene_type:complete